MEYKDRYLTVMGAVGLFLSIAAWGADDAPTRQALQFDGSRDVATAKLNTPLDGDLTLEAWVCSSAATEQQERIMGLTGPGGTLQVCTNDGRFIIDNEGGPTKGIVGTGGHNDGRWHHVLIKRYKKTTYALYVDGIAVGSCTGSTPIYTDLYLGTAPGKPAFNGYIDEVRLYDRCLTDAEGLRNYLGRRILETDARGISRESKSTVVMDGLVGWWKLDGDVSDAVGGQDGRISGSPRWVAGRGDALVDEPQIEPDFYPAAQQIGVDVDVRLLGKLPPDAAWQIVLQNGNRETVKEQTVAPMPPALTATIAIPTRDLPPGHYDVIVSVRGADGAVIANAASRQVTVTDGANRAANVRVLNNLVSELLTVPGPIATTGARHTFITARDGWTYIAAELTDASEQGHSAEATLDSLPAGRDRILRFSNAQIVHETTRYLPAGEHTLTVHLEGDATLSNLVVRSIPEIIFDEYGQKHNMIRGFVPRDHAFMRESDLLATSTTFRGSGWTAPLAGHAELKAAGKRWIEMIPIGDDSTAEAAAERWIKPMVVHRNWFDGVAVDEFMQYTTLRNEALRILLADPHLDGKWFYPLVCAPVEARGGSEGVKFLQRVIDAGFHPVWERYMQEPARQADGWPVFDRQVRDQVKRYWWSVRPDAMQHTIIILGNFMSSPGISLNVHPDVDFRVWMDMQYHYLANDPMFFGLAGISEWTSGWADDTYLQWAGKLHRHYAIEGRRDLLSPQYGLKFKLTHIKNPDFDEGLTEWNVDAAHEGSVGVKQFAGYSFLQTRYPQTTQGDRFLWMQRDAEAPNRVSQPIRDLVPGRLYSLKMISSDYHALTSGKSAQREQGLVIQLDNVELLPERCFDETYRNLIASPEAGFDTNNPYWSTYHQRIFRATPDPATLTVTDWDADGRPAGPVGEEMIFNFVEVEPCLPE